MTIRIENSFQVDAPVRVVWDFFQDVYRVVPCVPGTSLTREIESNSFEGEAQVKLGFMTVKFGGVATIERIDPEEFQMLIKARGNQKGAIGRAEASVLLTLHELEAAVTEVVVAGDLTIFGKLAQIGGGMIQTVAKQVFIKFSECASREILAGIEEFDIGDVDQG